jgi:hypothetical protein
MAGALVFGVGLAQSPTVVALPLGSVVCSGLNQERNTLETSGVLNDLRMTSVEAKELAKDRLERIQRYVEISGQILFRCPVAAKLDIGPSIGGGAAPGSASAQQPKPKTANVVSAKAPQSK